MGAEDAAGERDGEGGVTHDLFAGLAPARPSIDDQLLAAELWEQGLRDWVERHGSSRSRRPVEEIARKRHQLVTAGAVVETLRSLRTTAGTEA